MCVRDWWPLLGVGWFVVVVTVWPWLVCGWFVDSIGAAALSRCGIVAAVSGCDVVAAVIGAAALIPASVARGGVVTVWPWLGGWFVDWSPWFGCNGAPVLLPALPGFSNT